MPGSSEGLVCPLTRLPSTRYDSTSHRFARSDSSASRRSSSRRLDWPRSRYSAPPKATTVMPSATVYQKASRRRMVVMSALHHVAHAANGVDQFVRMPRVHLLAQPVDHHVNDVGAGIEVIVPGILGDQGTGHHPPRVSHEVLENGVLLGRQLDQLSGAADLAGGGVELEVCHLEHGGAELLGAAAQGLHPGQQLLERKRLGDVVVGTHPERLDLPIDRVLGG